MGKVLVSALLLAVVLYTGFCVFLWATQRGIMYFPTPRADAIGAENISLESEAETLQIWRAGGERSNALIYFGGNAENVAYSTDWFAQTLPDHTIYLVNYRGYGGSTGEPSEEALLHDATVVFDHVAKKHDSISVMGRSLGSGVATHLASLREVDKLVLVTPFDSMVNVAAGHYPLFPVRYLLKDRYDSEGRVPQISAPALILIAGNDKIIRRRRSDALVDAFPPTQIDVVVFEETGHNSIESAPGYAHAIAHFLATSSR